MGKLRIIGGKWRSRTWEFPDREGLRPTHDRIRETLFNWLSPYILNSFCLDLFSGSGALGFEALSRGAEKVYFLDNNRQSLNNLKNTAEKFQAKNAEILFSDFPTNMPNFSENIFEIVFLDPPYNLDLVIPSLNWLSEKKLLKVNAKIYVEMEKSEAQKSFPSNFEIIKNNSTKTIEYFLLLQKSHDY